MSVGKHAALGAAGLAVLEAGSGGLGNWLVSIGAENIVNTVTAATNWVISSVDPYFTWGLATAATAGWALWTWSDKYWEKWISGVVESTAWRYGLLGTALTATGIAAMPATLWALAVWGGLMALREVSAWGREFAQDPLGNIGWALKAPFKWAGSAMASLRGRWAATA